MAIRFRRTVKLAPGVRLNLGKRGVSVRVGGRGLGVTTGTSGTRVSAGIPGTGLYATKKVSGAPKRASSRPAQVTAGQPMVAMTLEDAVATLGPAEKGLAFPAWWLAGAVLCLIATFTGAPGAVVVSALCGYMVWRRLNAPKYTSLEALRSARAHPTPEEDESVRAAAAKAEDSWTVQRDAGLYFMQREQPARAVEHLAKAVDLYPGDKRALVALASSEAIHAEQYDYAVSLLEPYLATASPDDDELDCVLVTQLALAFVKKGDPGRALEVLNRLPLRRQKLSQPLLLGLCVRALAKHALGQRASAKRDVDRVYAFDPDFAYLDEVRRSIGEAAV
ncbi:MAG: DUF4236 domain-containing protein [Coriobacteriales bacterium]|nr:DUF4236 domain-containing protein [Actinomycetes bacterium]